METESVRLRLALLQTHVQEWKALLSDETRFILAIQAKFLAARSELKRDDWLGLAVLATSRGADFFDFVDVSRGKHQLVKERQQQEFLDLDQQIGTDRDKLS